MTDTPSSPTADQLLASCRAGKETAADVIQSHLGNEWSVRIGEPTKLDPDQLSPDWKASGLFTEISSDGGDYAFAFPTASETLPDWFRPGEQHDAEKADKFFEALAEALLPATWSGGQIKTAQREELQDGLTSFAIADRFVLLPIEIETAGETVQLWLAGEPRPAGAADVDAETSASSVQTAASPAGSRPRIQYKDLEDGIKQLPPFARSLLKVQVPISVNLATKRISVLRALDIGPGSILQFDKSCESPLTLEAGGQEIAVGEAVKVGDKFGLWITSIAMPEERFWVLRGNSAERVK